MCAIAFRGVLGVQQLIVAGFVHWSSIGQHVKNTTAHNILCNSSIFFYSFWIIWSPCGLCQRAPALKGDFIRRSVVPSFAVHSANLVPILSSQSGILRCSMSNQRNGISMGDVQLAADRRKSTHTTYLCFSSACFAVFFCNSSTEWSPASRSAATYTQKAPSATQSP